MLGWLQDAVPLWRMRKQVFLVFVDYYRDEELGSIGVLAGVGHRQPASAVMLQFEVLVSKPEEKKSAKPEENEEIVF